MLNTKTLDDYFRTLLSLDEWSAADSSLNGLQVDNSGAEITKIAFAVDACIETFARAAECGAGMVFVHHGLFWGSEEHIRGAVRARLKFLFDHDIALYAAHLPLDAHPVVGNNAVLAEKLGLTNIEPFGSYHNRKIGFKGALSTPLTLDEAAEKIAHNGQRPAALLPFGKQRSATCAVVSGGAAMEALQAIAEGVDLYVTGESSHSIYHHALEGGLNMLCGGHYATETGGVQRLAEKVQAELGAAAEFIDIPTGL